MSERIRLTISVTPEVHAIFSRMAEAGGVSLGKCMGDWLGDTAEGAQFVTMKMEEARKAPKTVMRELQAMASGLHEAISERIGRPDGAAGGSAARSDERTADVAEELIQRARRKKAPPSSNTGGKSPGKTRGPAQKRSSP